MAHTLFSDVTVIDGGGAEPLRASVLVSGQRIASIMPSGAPVAVPDGAEVIDGTGLTLMRKINPGYLADLLLVDGDPLADVRILQDRSRLLGIMKDGAFHKRPVARAMAQRLTAE